MRPDDFRTDNGPLHTSRPLRELAAHIDATEFDLSPIPLPKGVVERLFIRIAMDEYTRTVLSSEFSFGELEG